MTDDTDDEMRQVNHLVPASDVAAAKAEADWGELSEIVRAVYTAFARAGGDTERARLEAELQRVEARRESLAAEREQISEEIASLDDRAAEIERQMAAIETTTEAYESAVDGLVTRIRDGQSVWPDHKAVQDAAAIRGCSAETVIDEVRSRCPDASDDQFTEGAASSLSLRTTDTANDDTSDNDN